MSVYKNTDDDFREAAKRATNKAEMARLLGRRLCGGAYWTIDRKIKELNIDTSHFTGKPEPKLYYQPNPKKNITYYLVKRDPNKPYLNGGFLKRRLIEDGVKEHRCEICGLSEWNGQKIPLQVHHVNGDRSDNRLENLQLLCPNCHMQTDNWGSHNKHQKDVTSPNWDDVDKRLEEERERNERLIAEHKKGISEQTKRRHSKTNNEPKLKRNKSLNPTQKEIEQHEKQRKCERPSKEELEKLIYEKPFLQIGKMYTVSDNAVRKWCKQYGLKYKRKDIKCAGDGTVDVTGREPVEA